MQEIIIFMTLYIDRESVEAIHESLVSQLFLPLSPLIIKHIIKRWYSVSLLPLIQEIYIGGRRI